MNGIKGITIITTMMNRSTTNRMSILLIRNLMTTTLVVWYSIITMAGMANMMMLFINSSFKYHLLIANMILMLIFLSNWLLNKNLHALNFLKMLGWVEYGKKHHNGIAQKWIALKRMMRARFVPSYYARDLINKLQ
jgi:hypothetical protein